VLKSTSEVPLKINSGLAAELQVVRLLQSKNWNLIFHRLKTRVAEVDLIFERGPQIILVEVKTLNSRWRADQRLGRQQLEKLKMNRTMLSYFARKKSLDAYIAWVEKDNVVTFCEVD
jgi:Holliday junction resolvase-like predicted endonuclease